MKQKRRNRGWNSNCERPARRADETTIEPRYRMRIHALTYLNSACLLDSRKSESIDFYLSTHQFLRSISFVHDNLRTVLAIKLKFSPKILPMELKSCIVFELATPKGRPPNKELKYEISPISLTWRAIVTMEMNIKHHGGYDRIT